MKCQEFEAIVGADPNTSDANVLAHAEACTTCAAYLKEMQALDRLIRRALEVPVDTRRTMQPRGAARRYAWLGRWQVAASLIASVMLATSIWIATARDSLAEEITAHVERESFVLARHERLDPSVVGRVLHSSGISLRGTAADVTFAATCRLRGHEVPHLVVQTERGAITVLVLAHERPVDGPQRFEENDYSGVIVPAPRGVLAILGKDAPIEEVAERLLKEVIWL